MLGKSYWKEVQSVSALTKCAHDLLGELGHFEPEESESLYQVSQPYQIAFLGTPASGKSSLIDALIKKHSQEESGLSLGSTEFLEVSIKQGSESSTPQDLVGKADVVVILLHPENPWDALIWNTIEKLKAGGFPLILCLSMADQIGKEEVEVLKNHLDSLTRQRLGESQPVMGVSVSSPHGMIDLEQEVESLLEASVSRSSALAKASLEVGALLRDAEQAIDFRRSQLHENVAHLSALEGEVRELRQVLAPKISQDFEDLAVLFVRVAKSKKKSLREMLSLLPTFYRLFRPSSIATELEEELNEEARELLLSKVALSGRDLIEGISGHWSGIEKKIEEKIGSELTDFEMFTPRFHEVQIAHLAHIGNFLPGLISQLRLKSFLDGEVSSHQSQAQRYLVIIFLLLAISGVLGVFAPQVVAWSGVLLSGGALFYTMFRLKHSAMKVQSHYEDYTSRAHHHFKEQMEPRYEVGIRTYFRVYSTLLNGLRSDLLNRQEQLGPLSEKWNQLFFEYHAMKTHKSSPENL